MTIARLTARSHPNHDSAKAPVDATAVRPADQA
jgi:hypothetical protein